MEKKCNGWFLSQCCGASISDGDICANCKKKCTNQCKDCPDDDRENCEEIEKS